MPLYINGLRIVGRLSHSLKVKAPKYIPIWDLHIETDPRHLDVLGVGLQGLPLPGTGVKPLHPLTATLDGQINSTFSIQSPC